jgi:hypothetical protein
MIAFNSSTPSISPSESGFGILQQHPVDTYVGITLTGDQEALYLDSEMSWLRIDQE